MPSLKEACVNYYGNSDLYEILNISKSSTNDEIKKAYKKLSLQVHPDRVDASVKEIATEKFKVLGKIHSILSDPEKKAIYDETGDLSDENVIVNEERDWYQYWRLLFSNVTIKEIEEYEKKYKDSSDEMEDLVKCYLDGKGDMDYILNHVPYSNPLEEPRLRGILQKLIDNEELVEFSNFTNESPRKRESRKRKYKIEASKAQKEKEKKGKNDQVDEDVLSAILLKKEARKEQADAFFKHLEEKYSKPKQGRSKKGGK